MTKQRNVFTKAMRRTHTIYMPDMLPYHGQLFCAAFRHAGYRLKIVPEASSYPKETYSTVSQDYCSPGIHIIGNALALVKELERKRGSHGGAGLRIAFLEPQSGGICKAGNLYHALINSLRRSGYSDIPVISLNPHAKELQSGFRLGPRLLTAGFVSVLYSDLLMQLTLQTRPYEKEKGSTDRLHRKWLRFLSGKIARGHCLFFRRAIYRRILKSYREIPLRDSDAEQMKSRVKVGISGEIFSKCAPSGNRHLEEVLQEQGLEYRLGGFLNYLIYVVYTESRIRQLGGTIPRRYVFFCNVLQKYMEACQRELCREMRRAGYNCDSEFSRMEKYAGTILDTGYNIGDGWLTAAEACDYIESGYRNVLLCHPFTCLVSHVGSRGIIKNLKKRYPKARVTSVEYDIHGSKAMLDSRILMALSALEL
ncbi:MAG: hypothetical protein IJT43_08155 [Stomatobaculum sp.]|nr:hypothetical protein [Stomatobaculum sp.]